MSRFEETLTLVTIKAEKKLKEYCCVCGSIIENQVCPIHGLEFKPILTPKFKIDFKDEMGFIYEKIEFSYLELLKILPPALKTKLALIIDQLRATQVTVIKLKKANTVNSIEKNIRSILTKLFLNHADYQMGAFIFQERVLRGDGTKVCFAILPEIEEDHETILITLMSKALIVRNLFGYIYWRKKLGAKLENIVKSLKTTRRFIITIDGFEGEIKEIDYNPDTQKFLNAVIHLKNGTERIYRISEVFHDETSGIMGTKTQFQINEALRTFSQHFLTFTNQMDLPKLFEGVLGLEKADNLAISFEKPQFYLDRALNLYLGGVPLPIPLSYMNRFWSYEVSELRKNKDAIDDWGKKMEQKDPLPLLLISCTRNKFPGVQPVSALVRYQGPLISLVRRIFLFNFRKNNLPSFNVLFFSAKYGPLAPQQPIPTYDQIMTPERLEELSPKLIEKIRSLKPNALFINLSKNYFVHLDLKDDSITKIVAKGNYRTRYDQTKKILREWAQI